MRMRHRGLPCANLALKCALFTLSSQLAFEFFSGNIGNFNWFSLERFFDIRTYLLVVIVGLLWALNAVY